MSEIGIVTTSNAVNYGAVLQAYALKTTLSEVTGANVKIINYTSDLQIMGRKVYRPVNGLKSLCFNIFVFVNYPYRKKRKKLIYLFDKFKYNELGICTEEFNNLEEIEKNIKCDILIAGSDQIWNLNLINDEVYFLSFKSNAAYCTFYSYATSIAEAMTEEQQRQFVKRLKKFQGISIRENKTALELEQLIGRKIENNIDPVFLLSFNRWKSFAKIEKKSQISPYIFVFMIGHDSTDQQICDCVRKYYNLPVKQLNLHPIKRLHTDEVIQVATPKMFLKLIFEAEVIVTDSFHATSFSILANKPFYSIKRSVRNGRIENLFDVLNVPDRFISISSYDNLYSIPEINYRIVEKKILSERLKAFQYFNDIMEGQCID